MQTKTLSHHSGGTNSRFSSQQGQLFALNEHDLAARWGLSVKTLRRWRQQLLGPAFCKLGSRVTYLVAEIEVFERKCSRFTVSARQGG
jgi:hypothetical protein